MPICRSGSICDRKAEEWVEGFGKQSMPTLELGTKVYERCGKIMGVKKCPGCNVLAWVGHVSKLILTDSLILRT